MRDDKSLLRREISGRFRALPPGELVRRGELARARLAAADEFRAAGSFLLYAALPDEVDTAPLIDELLAAGKVVFLPVCSENSFDIAVVPVADRARDLVPRKYGILAPRPGLAASRPEDVDFALVPGRAFDRAGRRLGRGHGCYDRFLPQLRPDAVRAALILDFQLVPVVPVGPTDQPVGLIATEHEVIRIGGGVRP